MSKKEESKQLDILPAIHGNYATKLTKKYKARTGWQAKDPRQVISFIPGTITSVDVTVGQEVQEGETLLTFKAMKMLNTYKSPVAGKVAKILVAPGDIVPKGILLIEFE